MFVSVYTDILSMYWVCVSTYTSIPQKSGNLPQKSGTYTRKIRKFFLLREASRLLFKFYVRSYIRTFISFRMYYRIPPENYFLSGPKNRGSGWACQICEAILPNFAKQYDQILRSNMTKICEANHTLWAVPVCLDAAAHVLRADESPWKESPAE